MPTTVPDLHWTYLGDVVKSEDQPDGSVMVYGVATGPKMDLDLQGCNADWLRTAIPSWMKRGNIREQHRPDSAVGKAKQAIETEGSEWMIAAKVVDPVAVTKVREKVYTGFSIGIKGATIARSGRYPKGEFVGGDIIEVSLVDYPAYLHSKIATSPQEVGFPVLKAAGTGRWQYAGMVIEDVAAQAVSKAAEAVAREERARAALEAAGAPRPGYAMPVVTRPGVTTPEEALLLARGVRPDVARLVAAEDVVYKRDYSAEERAGLARDGKAIPVKNGKGEIVGGRYPIDSEDDLDNAVQSVGRGAKADAGEIKAHITRQAKRLKRTDMLPADWEGSTREEKAVEPEVTKDGPGGQAPELSGAEAHHNTALRAALAAINQLIQQEAAEEEDEFDCIADLAYAGSCLVRWAQGEAAEHQDDGYMQPTLDAVMLAARVEDRAERRTSITTITKALRAAGEKAMPEPVTAPVAPEAAKALHGPFTGTHSHPHPAMGDQEGDDSHEHEHSHDGDADHGHSHAEKAAAPETAPPAPDEEKAGRTISAATASRLIDIANTPGTPANVRAQLMAMANPEEDGTQWDRGGEKAKDTGAAGDVVAGRTTPPTPERIDLTSPTRPSETGGTFPGDYPKAVTADEVRAIAVEVVTEVITSDAFVTKLAEASQAKVAVAEVADATKAATTDLTTKVGGVQGDVEKVRRELQAEIDRIKALPQAPRAVSGALPQGVQVVEKLFQANPAAPAPQGEVPELAALLQKAAAGDVMAQRQIQAAVAAAGSSPDLSRTVLEATYAGQRR